MVAIQLARVLPWAKQFRVGNVNDVWRGMVLTSDLSQRPAIIKDLDQRELVNELLASVLAAQLGLPVPEAYIGIVLNTDLNVTKAPTMVGGERMVFVSTDVMSPNLTQQIQNVGSGLGTDLLFDNVIKWSELGKLYAFDTWIANIDRHAGNLLIGGKSKYWLIDHGRSFTGPNWSGPSLDAGGIYVNRMFEWLTGRLSFGQKQARAIEAALFANLISLIDVPDAAKLSLIELLIPADQVSAVNNFLTNRMQHVTSHTKLALGIPGLVP